MKICLRPPRLDHIRVFGWNVLSESKESCLIVFSSTQKGYKLYDLDAKAVFISRDVVSREDVFLFKVM